MRLEGIDRRAGFTPETDVLVAGGGAAGLAAAVTAARCEPRALRGEDVRDRLNRDGARLDAAVPSASSDRRERRA